MNTLFSIGDPVSDQEQLDVVLEGLPEEYDPLINLVNSRFEPFDLDKPESLLLAQEVRLEKYKQRASSASAMVNVASVPSSDSSVPPQVNLAQNTQLYSADSSQYFRGGRNGRGRGRGGGRSSTQCQVCKKYGREATVCWYRFEQHYTPPPPRNNSYGPPRFSNSVSYHQQPQFSNNNSWNQPHKQSAPPQAMLTSMNSGFSGHRYPDSGASHHVAHDVHNIQ